jgi:hypothetical protein
MSGHHLIHHLINDPGDILTSSIRVVKGQGDRRQ